MQHDTLDLRRVDNMRWQVMMAVGNGRVLELADRNMQLEVFHPPWSTHGRRLGPRATFDSAVRCRLGDMLTDGAGALWCLLGGVPMSSPDATMAEREVRQSIALTRAPAALTAILGPLAPLPLPTPTVDESGAQAVIGPDALEMMLRLTREDVSVYSRGLASPSLWLSLLNGMGNSAVHESLDDDHLPAVDQSRVISSAVSIAAGSLSATAIKALEVGDVVRLPTTFRPDGTGSLRISDVDVGVKWRSRSPEHVFEVTSVTVRPWASGEQPLSALSASSAPSDNSRVPLEQFMMNVESPGDLDGRYASDGTEEMPLDESPSQPPQGASPPLSAVDTVPIRVVAEIGTLTMSLGDLSRLRPGTLIKLGGRGEDEAVLRAVDGPALAYGELVDIGGHVGLQISRLADA